MFNHKIKIVKFEKQFYENRKYFGKQFSKYIIKRNREQLKNCFMKISKHEQKKKNKFKMFEV